jgi:hypothetical protein
MSEREGPAKKNAMPSPDLDDELFSSAAPLSRPGPGAAVLSSGS